MHRNPPFPGRAFAMAAIALACSLSAAAGNVPLRPDLDRMKEAGVIFYAPFEGDYRPAIAGGRSEPYYADRLHFEDGVFGQALRMVPHARFSSSISYEAPGNLRAEAGTLCFWIKPGYDMADTDILRGNAQIGPMPFVATSVEKGFYHLLLIIIRRADRFYFQYTHADGLETVDHHEGIASWKAGEWRHVAFAWDMDRGVRIYDNGRQIYSSWGRTKLDPLTPIRFALGSNAGARVSRNPFPTSYDELLILDRPVDEAELAAIMAGDYAALRPAEERPLSEHARQVARSQFNLDEDPARIAFRPVASARGKALTLRADLLDIEEVKWQYKHGFKLADGDLRQELFLTEGGLAHPQETEVVFAEESEYNYVVLHGRPMPGTVLRTAGGDVGMAMRPGRRAVRAEVPFARQRAARMFFEGDSILQEAQFFRCLAAAGPEVPADAEWHAIVGEAPADAHPELRASLLRFPQAEDRRLFLAEQGGRADGAVEVPPLSPFNVVLPPGEEERAAGRLHVHFLAALPQRSNVIRATVHHPFDSDRAYFDLDFAVDAAAIAPGTPIRLALDISASGMVLPNDRPLSLSLFFDGGARVMLGGGGFPSGVAVVPMPLEEAVPAFVRREIWAMNDVFTARMGLNRFDNPGEPREQNPLRIAFARIFRYDPDNPTARNLFRWARFEPWPPFEMPQGEPQWAILSRELLDVVTRQIHWWIDHRQDERGYVVGDGNEWNDVTKLFKKYHLLPLITDDAKLRGAMDRYLDAHWELSGRMTDGFSTYLTDILHSAEEATYISPAMAMLEYGRPKHVLRLMETADFLQRKIIRQNEFGEWAFRGNYFASGNMRLEGVHGSEDPRCQSVTTPATALVWQSGNPAARQLMLDWGESVLARVQRPGSDGEKAGYPYFRYDFNTGELDKRYNTYNRYYLSHLEACWRMTGDERFLAPIEFLLANPEPDARGADARSYSLHFLNWRQNTGNPAYDELFVRRAAEAVEAIERDAFFQRGVQYYDIACLLAWEATRDKSYLLHAMKHSLRNNHRGMLAYTEIDPDTDRVYPWGVWALSQMYLGGQVLTDRASKPYPMNYISWEGTGTDFAALVLDSSPASLKLIVCGFEAEDRPVTIRNWRLSPGVYRVRESVDLTGDDNGDRLVREQTVELREMSPIAVTLPARRTHVIEFEQLEALPGRGPLPDLAVGPEDVEITLGSPGEGLISAGPFPPRHALRGIGIPFVRVRVHNIGAADAGPFRVAVKDGRGRVVNERVVVDGLEAPLDLKPRFEWITLRLNEHEENVGPIEIVVDPDGEVEEICKANNRVRVPLPPTRAQ